MPKYDQSGDGDLPRYAPGSGPMSRLTPAEAKAISDAEEQWREEHYGTIFSGFKERVDRWKPIAHRDSTKCANPTCDGRADTTPAFVKFRLCWLCIWDIADAFKQHSAENRRAQHGPEPTGDGVV
jgi:hypothetical protein